MSKSNNNKSSNSNPPAPPPPQNEYFYEDDMLRSQRTYDNALRAYVSKSFSTPDEMTLQNRASGFLTQLFEQMPQSMNLSPDAIAGYRNAYAQPQINALNESYNQAMGQANTAAHASGMRNSVGFNDYLSGQLERNRAQGLADISANSKMMEYDIPRRMLAPYADAYNLASGALSGEQNRTMAYLEPSFTGSQAASNLAMQNYQNQLNYWQLRNQPRPRVSLFGGF